MQLLDELDRAAARHGQVEREHVGPQPGDLTQCFRRVAGFTNNFEIRLASQKRAQSAANHGVVVS